MIRMQEIMEEMRILTIILFYFILLNFPFFQYEAGTLKGGLSSEKKKKGDSQLRDTIIREREKRGKIKSGLLREVPSTATNPTPTSFRP